MLGLAGIRQYRSSQQYAIWWLTVKETRPLGWSDRLLEIRNMMTLSRCFPNTMLKPMGIVHLTFLGEQFEV